MASSSSTAQKKKKSGGNGGKPGSDTETAWESRAVVRLIEAGSVAECPHCHDRVKFRARHRDQQVICNVYDQGKWQRVEQYHLECYEAADAPYGDAVKA